MDNVGSNQEGPVLQEKEVLFAFSKKSSARITCRDQLGVIILTSSGSVRSFQFASV